MESELESDAKGMPPGEVRLEAIFDTVSIRALVEDFHDLTGHVMSLVDLDDRFLVRVGWHDACEGFHRRNAECCELCRVSDVDMTEGVARGETRAYKCGNGLWHVVTPLFLAERHVGNVFTSQFFYDDEEIDTAAFEAQAARFGFDRDRYLAAIEALPRYSHATVDSLMHFFVRLTEQIAVLGLTNLRLAETMSARELALEARVESESRLVASQRLARVGNYSFDIASRNWDCSEVLMDIFGIDDSYVRDYEGWLGIIHADDREMMGRYVAEQVFGARCPFDKEYRISRVSDGAVRWVHGLGELTYGENGAPETLFGIIQDVTDRQRADDELSESRGRLTRMVYDVAEAMGRVVEARDPYTQGHQQRVADLAKRIAARMGLSPSEIDEVEMAGLLHDVGKLRIPTEILNKPGRLSTNEFALVKGHPEQGFEILKDIAFPWAVAEITRQHHERMDGSGYPRGLSGGEILVAARILEVADVVEAMASHRPYRPTLGIAAAMEEIVSHPQRHDRRVIAACISLYEDGELGL